MTDMASQITRLTIVYSAVYSDADQRKHQGSASLAFVRGIHRWPVNSPHKGPVTRKMFPFDDTIMGIIKIGSRSKHHQPVVHFCNGWHTECQPCAGNSTHFDCEQLCLIQSKFYDVENSAPLVGLEPTTARLHDERSDLWATKMWHFPIHGLLALTI